MACPQERKVRHMPCQCKQYLCGNMQWSCAKAAVAVTTEANVPSTVDFLMLTLEPVQVFISDATSQVL